ncbi:hypothetical protein ACM40_18955 [Chryseobacterium sp. BLS98]|uniref:FEKKY domain-containing protein n=1 Tax=Chryseobacterium sp. BLS98 TaxID=885586 RepID=UPI00065AE379|nr:hypothetical protein [Chryseobacterium sp. BLS98]KMQ59031.1 hypothetical protein ACM40_18955 [Chryseobacterium sp. BLS98]
MKVSGFLFVMMITLFSCKKDEGSYYGGYYWIYGYGLPVMGAQEAMDGISEKWKIKHYAVTGCMIEPGQEKAVNAANKRTYAALDRKYGKGWQALYSKDMNDFITKKVDVMDILITNKLFRNELKKYYIEIYDVDKEVSELNNDGDFRVIVYNNKLKYENKECFRLTVNTKNKTVNIIQ